ncbi:MAG: chromosome partitioning protein [Candidatus Marinimicrobia bacterium]|nr:chromosome partitioning protein [Candidatus Neomarinimicrobiota bacterium]
MIKKQAIIDILKTVKYPGFSRDIVSFGVIKEIRVNEQLISLVLSIKSNDKKIISRLDEDIKKSLLLSKLDIEKVKIKISLGRTDSDFKPTRVNGIKKIIAIGSAKGGVGKSTLAMNLAVELGKKNKVGFLDLDIYGPSLPLMVSNNQTPEIIRDKLIPIDKYGLKLMSFGFLNQDNAPAIWRGPMVAKLTNQFFDNVNWGELDLLIIDLPPGTGDIQLTLSQKIDLDGVIIITTPQKIALEDVRKGSDMFKKVNMPILGIIENMSYISFCGKITNKDQNSIFKNSLLDIKGLKKPVFIDRDGSFKVNFKIFDGPGGISESRRLGLPLLGEIPIEPILAASTDSGHPFMLTPSADSIASKQISKISSTLIERLGLHE